MSHAPGAVLKPLVKLGRTPGDCYTWIGNTDDAGVAIKQFAGKSMPARRWMWMQLFGPIPDGLIVANTCGNKACVNPHHLRACFQAEANREAVNTLLLPADVAEIRAARKSGLNSAGVLAEKYGVSKRAIYDVCARRTWSKPKPNFGPIRDDRTDIAPRDSRQTRRTEP